METRTFSFVGESASSDACGAAAVAAPNATAGAAADAAVGRGGFPAARAVAGLAPAVNATRRAPARNPAETLNPDAQIPRNLGKLALGCLYSSIYTVK